VDIPAGAGSLSGKMVELSVPGAARILNDALVSQALDTQGTRGTGFVLSHVLSLYGISRMTMYA
jgi:hypothetical protein